MPPLSIMIKPASSLCNMRCRYCFYHDVSQQRDVKNFGIMSEETAENLISKALKFANGDSVAFAFQGGEPLIAGLDYFKKFTALVKKHNHLSSKVFFSLQTNGTLVTKEWAEFFKENQFLIGLSLDGDFENNRFRVDDKEQNTFYKILGTAQLFQDTGVDFNILTVLTGNCAENIEDIYKFVDIRIE